MNYEQDFINEVDGEVVAFALEDGTNNFKEHGLKDEKKVERTRVNITISNELKEWYQKQAESFGCPMSSMMAIALAQYKQQQEGLTMMQNMGKLNELLEQLQKQSKGQA
jgi:hypothetical protein